jgi:hypothetical protein
LNGGPGEETKENRRGGEGRSPLIAGDQRESKRRGGHVFLIARDKENRRGGRTGLL